MTLIDPPPFSSVADVGATRHGLTARDLRPFLGGADARMLQAEGAMRVARLVLTTMMVLSVAVPAAAADEVVWSRHLRGSIASVDAASEGGAYLAGEVLTDTDHVMVVARYGPAGGRNWRTTWRPGPRFLAWGASVAAVPAGGAYVGGAVGGRATAESSPPVIPVIRRYSPTGTVVWSVRLPLPSEAVAGVVVGLAADGRGVVAAVDTYASTNYGGVFHDGALWAFDALGHLRWRRDFEAPGISGTFDGVGDVAIGPNGLVYAVGHVDRTRRDDLADPPSDEDLMVQQLTRGGALRWSRTLSDVGPSDRDDAVSVAVRPGLVVVGGYVDGRPATLAYQHAERSRAWVGAFDPQGTRLWSHRWGDRAPTREVTSVAIAAWGPLYVAAVRGRHGLDPSSVLRRYAEDGSLVGERSRAGVIAGVATSDDTVYVASRDRLERWPR